MRNAALLKGGSPQGQGARVMTPSSRAAAARRAASPPRRRRRDWRSRRTPSTSSRRTATDAEDEGGRGGLANPTVARTSQRGASKGGGARKNVAEAVAPRFGEPSPRARRRSRPRATALDARDGRTSPTPRPSGLGDAHLPIPPESSDDFEGLRDPLARGSRSTPQPPRTPSTRSWRNSSRRRSTPSPLRTARRRGSCASAGAAFPPAGRDTGDVARTTRQVWRIEGGALDGGGAATWPSPPRRGGAPGPRRCSAHPWDRDDRRRRRRGGRRAPRRPTAARAGTEDAEAAGRGARGRREPSPRRTTFRSIDELMSARDRGS